MIFSAQGLSAQAIDTVRLFNEIKQVQAMFRDKELAVDMRYTYADENRPQAVLDSLKGNMEVTKAGSRYEMANVLCVSNSRYVIVMFRDDKLMYLSKAFPMAPVDPFQQVRAMISQGSVKSFSTEILPDAKKLLMSFDEQAPCKKIEMETDLEKGYVKSIRYVIRTEMIKGGLGELSSEEGFGEYAVVTVYFEKYRKPDGDTVRFDEHSFFYREGDEIKTTPAYSDYTIFKASTNL
ncbi:hypothetical protein [Chitinophaga barathri]|nr:hypothetical protein [Chitinophaga barathri]